MMLHNELQKNMINISTGGKKESKAVFLFLFAIFNEKNDNTLYVYSKILFYSQHVSFTVYVLFESKATILTYYFYKWPRKYKLLYMPSFFFGRIENLYLFTSLSYCRILLFRIMGKNNLYNNILKAFIKICM